MLAVTKLSTALQELLRLTEIVEAIEESGGEIPEDLVPVFDATVGNIKRSVDKRIYLIEHTDMLITQFETDIKYLQRRLTVLNKIKTSVRENTKALMESIPNISFDGTVKRFRLTTNGGLQPVIYENGDRTLQVLKNVIDPADLHKVPDDYYEWTKVAVLKKKEFEEDLRKGDLLCDLAMVADRGKHLRIA